MSLTAAQSNLVEQIEKILPLYQNTPKETLNAAAAALAASIAKVKVGALSPEAWAVSAKEDFRKISVYVKQGEPGDEFAAGAGAQIDAAFAAPAVETHIPAAAAAPAAPATAAVAPAAAPTQIVEAPVPAAAAPVNAETFLAGLAAGHSEKLDWKTSVVDLLKLLGLDHSLAARRKAGAALGLSAPEVASIGSEEGNELLHGAIIKSIASGTGKTALGYVA